MNLSRRDFLKVAGFSLATLAFKPSVDKFFNAYSSPSKRLGSGSWLSSFPPEKFTVKEADFIFGASAENPLHKNATSARIAPRKYGICIFRAICFPIRFWPASPT